MIQSYLLQIQSALFYSSFALLFLFVFDQEGSQSIHPTNTYFIQGTISDFKLIVSLQNTMYSLWPS